MKGLTRRELLAATAGAAVAAIEGGPSLAQAADLPVRTPADGRLKQSVCRWPFAGIPLPEFCRAARGMGLAAVDLLQPEEWSVARDAGLVCALGYPSKRKDFIATGFNDRANHALLIRELQETIPLAAKAGVPSVITMFGNRGGKSDDDGAAACIEGLRRVAPVAEAHGVTLCVELLNSKVDHADYQGDHTAFGVRVVTGVGSPRVKLLYDIYHMQIMEGDVIRTIRDHVAHIGHFHTGGVPGRHELDDTQELNYHAIAGAIADAGFTGYLAHEFEPTREPLAALRDAVATCRV
ncbi:MAG TPA: TIM barrel protein [Gemmatimonadales bacterium]|nr:TIM barrel protein [Gemmatimonadales bacterium]